MKNVARRVYQDLCCGDPKTMLAIQDRVRETAEKNDVNVFVPHDLFGLQPKDITAEFLSELFEAASEIETRNYLNGTFIPKGTVISVVDSGLRFITYRLRKAKEWWKKIEKRCQTTNPLAVIMVNEGWMVSDPTWEEPVRNHPDRKDIFQLSLMSGVFRKVRTWLVKDEGQKKALEFMGDSENFNNPGLNKFFLVNDDEMAKRTGLERVYFCPDCHDYTLRFEADLEKDEALPKDLLPCELYKCQCGRVLLCTPNKLHHFKILKSQQKGGKGQRGRW